MKLELDTSTISKAQNIQSILDYAQSAGITTIDTAALYPYSEQTLGQYNLENFDVITKTIKCDHTLSRSENFERFKESFYLSQRKLGYIELYGLMFHDANDVLNDLSLWDLVSDFKDKEYVYKIGVSVTNPVQLTDILDTIDIDIVQLPLNLLDQRFAGILPELKQKGIEVHTRSTFHEGLILMNEWQIPEKYRDIKHVLTSIPDPKAAYALAYPKYLKEVNKITVGCQSPEDLDYFCQMYHAETYDVDFSKYAIKCKNM